MEITVKKENGMTITILLSDDTTAKQCVDAFVELMVAQSRISKLIEGEENDVNL